MLGERERERESKRVKSGGVRQEKCVRERERAWEEEGGGGGGERPRAEA